MIFELDVQKYLTRIGFCETLVPSLDVLTCLQELHLTQVPFENLDIHSGRRIELDIAAFFSKVVERERGGFCYELNGLFGTLLQSIGFNARYVSCRVCHSPDHLGPEFDHMAIVVALHEKEYLVDVGFGEFALHPLEIDAKPSIRDPIATFRMEPKGEGVWLVHELQEQWVPIYQFTTQQRRLADFRAMNDFHQTSPDSHFTKGRIISKRTSNGRITLTDRQLKRSFGVVTEVTPIDQNEFELLLLQHFGKAFSPLS